MCRPMLRVMVVMVYLLLPLLSFAQSQPDVFVFKSIATSQTIRNKDGKIIHEKTNRENGIPIVVDFGHAEVKTYGVAPIKITNYTPIKAYEDKDGNAVQTASGIDKSGTQCAIVLIMYKRPLSSGGIAMLDISYPLIDLAFELGKP